MKATRALVLFLLTVLLCPALASAGTLGPALNYEELLDMVRRAKDGDILLVSGEMTATEEAISSPALLQISGDGKAVLHRLHISDSSVILSDVDSDTFRRLHMYLTCEDRYQSDDSLYHK